MVTSVTFYNSTVGTLTVPAYDVVEDGVGSYTYSAECKCRVDIADIGLITALLACQGHITANTLESGQTYITTKGGQKGTLTIDGVAHVNCYIESITNRASSGAPFHTDEAPREFTIKFVQHTASSL